MSGEPTTVGVVACGCYCGRGLVCGRCSGCVCCGGCGGSGSVGGGGGGPLVLERVGRVRWGK